MKHLNESLEFHKAMRENRARLIAEEIKKDEDKKAATQNAVNEYYARRDMRDRLERNHARLLEGARDDALATVLKAIYITALEAETLTDEGLLVAESMVDTWIKENGGASKILSKVGNNSYLLSRITQIVEDAAEKEVAEIEAGEDDIPDPADAADTAKEFIANADKDELKDFANDIKQAVEDRKDELEIEKKEDAAEKAHEKAEKADEELEKAKEKAEDSEAEKEDKTDEEPAESEDKEEEKSEEEPVADEEEKSEEEPVKTDDTEETSDPEAEEKESEEEIEVSDKEEVKEEPAEEEPKADEKSEEEIEVSDKEEVKEEPAESEDKEDDSEEDNVEGSDDDDAENDSKDEDSDEPETSDDELEDDSDDEEDLTVDVDIEDDDNEDDEDDDITIDGEDDDEKDSTGKVFDELDKEDDVHKAIEIIRSRIADAEEKFIKNNAEDKKKVDELLNKIANNVKTVEDLDDKDSKEAKIAEESARMNKRRIDDIRDRRTLTVFEAMTRNFTKKLIKNEKAMEGYLNESGAIDNELVVETSKVMYGFLETLNTLNLEKVDEEYIKKVLDNM